jgi:APA family basic amino acid/polyamine antiporter
MNLMRTKPIDPNADTGLKRVLTAFDLTLLGIGCIIGTGIFVLTGIAAATYAGPGIIASFVVSGLACTFAALCYSELAAAIGGAGSAYGYAYAGVGEFPAWIVGWALILEYVVATATVAIGWSAYFQNALRAIGVDLPAALIAAPGVVGADGQSMGGLVNLPAVSIVLLLSILLCIGVKESARFNAVMVFVKLGAVLLFIALAAGHVQPANWSPFAPFGWSGIMSGAAIVFFAYIGFDAVSTAAEETVNPQRDLPIGIIASLAICTVLYMIVAAILTGTTPYAGLNTAAPVADVLLRLGYGWASIIIAIGAMAGITTVMLVLYYGLTRIFLAMSRDGLIPGVFSAINPNTRTPVRVILGSGILIAVIAGFTPINDVAELTNIGTLAAFTMVCFGVMFLRRSRPDLKRPFRVPGYPLVPVLGVLFCVYLMLSLPLVTWVRFAIWMALGLAAYFLYSRSHSTLAQAPSPK